MNNTWEIMVIINEFNDRVKNIGKFSKDYDDLKELYAQAIRLQCSSTCGLVQTVDDFIEDVKHGGITNYDGFGRFADFNGNEFEYVNCNVDWLKKNRKSYPFVFWYNK